MKRAKPTKANKTITLKESELRRIKEQCTDKAIETVLGMVYLTLHSQYGFGEKRLERFRLDIEKAADYLTQGKITVKDIQKYMKEDLKFDSRLWTV